MFRQSMKKQTTLLYLLFAVLFAACIWAVIHALKPIDTKGYVKVTVHSGDTLWEIASKYKDKGDTSSFVKWVEEANRINPDHIKAGDRLVIPIKKTNQEDHVRTELASR
ncbi:MAG: cell division suppressor protein YneA [Tuberibacillus sp.]